MGSQQLTTGTFKPACYQPVSRLIILLGGILTATLAVAQPEQPAEPTTAVELKSWLDDYATRLRTEQQLIGVSIAVSLPGGETVTAVAGHRDEGATEPLLATDRLMGGSTGKTYVAAITLQLAESGKIDLQAKAADYLSHHIEWFDRLPNADSFTVAQLLNHSAGIPHYIDDTGFLWRFLTDSLQGNDTGYSPETMLSFVLDEEPTTAPGAAHVYSDLNYFVLGLLIEQASGASYYEVLESALLKPYALEGAVPSNRMKIERLVPGHAETSLKNRLLGVAGSTMIDDQLKSNPAIEWTGGGLATTPAALSQFYRALGSGQVISKKSLTQMKQDALPIAPNSSTVYGYGVFVSQREELGQYISHAGWYPGYRTNVAYFERGGFSVAIQSNQDYAIDIFSPVREIAESVQRIQSAASAQPQSYRFTQWFNTDAIGSQMLSIDADKVSLRFEQRTQGKNPFVDIQMTRSDDLLPLNMSRQGLAYLYHDIDERFSISEEGEASWSSRAEQGSADAGDAHYFIPFSLLDGGASAPAELGLLAQALLAAPEHQLSLLPRGQARLKLLDIRRLPTAWGSQEVRLALVEGLALQAPTVWLDGYGNSFAHLDYGTVIRDGYADQADVLREAQSNAVDAYQMKRIQALKLASIDTTQQSLRVINAHLVDPATATLRENVHVTIDDGAIVAIGTGEPSSQPPIQTIDAEGHYLVPGLWDRHVHLQDRDRLLHLLGGVTTVVDLGNNNEALSALEAKVNSATLPGPRLIKAGFIDKRGATQTPFGILVDTEADALAAIDHYAEQGYQHIKLYGAIDPAWVPEIAARTHQHHMRLSGHVPTHSRAKEAIADGYDDIQHMIYLWLNFVRPPVEKELTFTAARAFEEGINKTRRRALLRAFVESDVGLDPTLAVYEEFLRAKTGKPKPAYRPYQDKLPLQTYRLSRSGPLPTPSDIKTDTFSKMFEASLESVGELHRMGARIIPGSDHGALPGLAFLRELELLAESGIKDGDILRLASSDAAKAYNADASFGTIAVGKKADMLLVSENPLGDISALRSLSWVFSRGQAYPIDALWQAVTPES